MLYQSVLFDNIIINGYGSRIIIQLISGQSQEMFAEGEEMVKSNQRPQRHFFSCGGIEIKSISTSTLAVLWLKEGINNIDTRINTMNFQRH